jgi:hypothetical protein
MKRYFLAMTIAMVMVFGAAILAGAEDRPSRGEQSKDAATSVERFNGKILSIENDFYVVEQAPGRETRVHIGKDTKMEGGLNPQKGDWIEAQVTREGHAKLVKKGKPAYTLEGDLLKVDGEFYTVKDIAGKEVKLHVNKETTMEGSYKIGERIVAEMTPEGHALSIKPARPDRRDPGTTFQP